MDFILEFLLELVVEGGMEASGNKKLSRWIRYPLMALTILFFLAVIGLIFYIGICVFQEKPMASVIIFLLGAFLLVGAVAKIRQLYFAKK